MARVVIAAAADKDTAAIIADLIGKAGAEIDAFYRRLERFPESGAPRRRLGSAVRLGVVFPYVAVLVLRVLHGRRKITRRMLRNP